MGMAPGGVRRGFRWLALAWRVAVALLAGAASVLAVNLAAGFIAQGAGLPPGGGPRLGWDLGALALSMAAGAWVAAFMAPVAGRLHALALLVLAGLAVIAGVAEMGADFPLWFNAGALLAAPLLAVPWLRGQLSSRR